MSYKNVAAVFSSILFLSLGSGRAWANAPNVNIPTRRAVRMIPEDGASSLPPNESSFLSVRTGVFDAVVGRVTTKAPMEQVQTGVFWTPQSLGEIPQDSLGRIPQFSIMGPAGAHILGNGRRESHDAQRPWLHKMWSRSWRGR
jgi:hypothetical protein